MENIKYTIFNEEYENYYSKIKGNNTTYSNQLRTQVSEISNQIENVKKSLCEWSGNACESYNKITDILINRFNEIDKNIKNYLEPACDAMDNLGKKLEELKTKDELVYEIQETLNLKLASPPPQKIDVKRQGSWDPEKKCYNKYTESVDNPDYAVWEREVGELQTNLETETLNLEKIKKECDLLINKIKKLETEIKGFSNLLGYASNVSGNDNNNFIVDFNSLGYDDKIAYLENLIQTYKKIYDSLNEHYKNKYGNGLEFNREDFENLNEIFNSFSIYQLATRGGNNEYNNVANSLLYDGKSFNLNYLTQILEYCDNVKFFDKLKNYTNGASWEESGLAELYKKDNIQIDEYSVALAFDYLNNEDVSVYLRNKLIQKNEKYETSYLKLMEEYNGYKATVNALNLSKAGYNSANEALKTAPYELLLNDKQYLEFIEDYKNNPDAYQDLKKVAIEQGNLIYNGKYDKYMTDEQKQLYYYQRYVLNDKEAANEYLTVISNSVKEAYAIDVSAEFVKDITHSDNWFETLLDGSNTAGNGFGDGLLDFFDGMNEWNKGLDEQDLIDYIQYYKTSFLGHELGDIFNPNDPNYERNMSLLNDMQGDSKLVDVMRQIYSTSNTIGYAAVPMALSYFGGGIAQGMGIQESTVNALQSWGTSLLSATSSGGNNIEEALNANYDRTTAIQYGISTTLANVLTGAGLETFFEINSTMIPEKFSNELLMDSSAEYIQELVEATSGNAMANVVLGEKRNLLDDAQEAGIEKFNTTAILGLGNKTGQKIHKPKFTKH